MVGVSIFSLTCSEPFRLNMEKPYENCDYHHNPKRGFIGYPVFPFQNVSLNNLPIPPPIKYSAYSSLWDLVGSTTASCLLHFIQRHARLFLSKYIDLILQSGHSLPKPLQTSQLQSGEWTGKGGKESSHFWNVFTRATPSLRLLWQVRLCSAAPLRGIIFPQPRHLIKFASIWFPCFSLFTNCIIYLTFLTRQHLMEFCLLLVVSL